MSTIKRVRSFSILVIILCSLLICNEKISITKTSSSSNVSNENRCEIQTEPVSNDELKLSSVTNLTEYSNWDGNFGEGESIVITNDCAIILTASQGLIVINVTDTSNPSLIDIWRDISNDYDYMEFVLRNQNLYILDTRGQITILDITNITDIQLVSYNLISFSNDLEIHEELLFVYTDTQFKIYNITTHNTMEFIVQYSNALFFDYSPHDIAIVDQTAFITSDYGLEVFNITDITNFIKIGNATDYLEYQYPFRITIHNDLAFIGTYGYGMVVYNITNQTNPFFIYKFLEDSAYEDLFYSWYFIDEFLLIHLNSKSLVVCNATNLLNITQIKTYDFDTSISVEKYADTLIITTYYKYVYFVDISNLLDITLTSMFDIGGKSIGVFATENFVYLANGGGGLEIISINDPANPVKVSTVFFDSFADGVIAANNLAFVACFQDGVYIVDISNPAEPLILSKYESTSGYHYYLDMAITGSLLYITNGYAGVEIVDISIPTSPVLINSFDLTWGFAQTIDIQDDLAAIVDGIYELSLYDIGSPIHPTLISSITDYYWGPREVEIEGDYVYVLNYFDGFSIVDIEKTFDPQVIIHYDIPNMDSFRDLAVWGEYVYLSNSYHGMFVIDCFDKEQPILIQRYTNSDFFYEIFASNNYVYLGNGYNGLQIFGTNKTKKVGFELPMVSFLIMISLLLCYGYKNKKRKRKGF